MLKKRWLQRELVHAVHDNDLEQFLSSIGILGAVISGTYQCEKCRKPINLDNLGAVYPDRNEIKVTCDLPPCLSDLELREDTDNG